MLRNRVITTTTSMIVVLIGVLGVSASGYAHISASGGTVHSQITLADSPWDSGGNVHLRMAFADSPWE